MNTPNSFAQAKIKNFAMALLFYTIIVILWGAWVRISHSGDGCGDTWPLCDGKLIPEAEQGKTWVEYIHRLMSGVYGLIVIYFWWICKKNFPQGSLARKAALWTLVFTISEALLGAKLVIFGLVASNDTPFRAFVMALHQVNSLLLSGSITVAWLGCQSTIAEHYLLKTPFKHVQRFLYLLILVAITGAWASLSTTLFPSESLLSGLMNDFSKDAHYLVRLRVLHPLLAISIGGLFIAIFWKSSLNLDYSLRFRQHSQQTALVFLIALGFGASTLLALSPVWMKIMHLTLVHVVWVLLIRWLIEKQMEPQSPK